MNEIDGIIESALSDLLANHPKAKDELKNFLVRVNGVTAYHRHHIPISKRKLDNLANAQIDLERNLGLLGD